MKYESHRYLIPPLWFESSSMVKFGPPASGRQTQVHWCFQLGQLWSAFTLSAFVNRENGSSDKSGFEWGQCILAAALFPNFGKTDLVTRSLLAGHRASFVPPLSRCCETLKLSPLVCSDHSFTFREETAAQNKHEWWESLMFLKLENDGKSFYWGRRGETKMIQCQQKPTTLKRQSRKRFEVRLKERSDKRKIMSCFPEAFLQTGWENQPEREWERRCSDWEEVMLGLMFWTRAEYSGQTDERWKKGDYDKLEERWAEGGWGHLKITAEEEEDNRHHVLLFRTHNVLSHENSNKSATVKHLNSTKTNWSLFLIPECLLSVAVLHVPVLTHLQDVRCFYLDTVNLPDWKPLPV